MAPESPPVEAGRFRWVVRPRFGADEVTDAIALRPATKTRLEDLAGFVTVTLLLGVVIALVACAIGVWETLP
jgi:hypothetical protein